MAERCSHSLSRIRHLHTRNIYSTYKTNPAIPYMTGLTNLSFNCGSRCSYMPLLIQCCTKLTNIVVYNKEIVILPLCRTNPLLQELTCYNRCGFTDTTLMELIHACPHLRILYLAHETDITDIGILALSEHCSQLQVLVISKCHEVTEAAVLQLLQRCRKLTALVVSRSSLSEETWTQLHKNTQKRVRRL